MGELNKSRRVARKALKLSRKSGDTFDEIWSISAQAWVAYLQGDIGKSAKFYQIAHNLAQEKVFEYKWPFGLSGFQEADYLKRIGNTDYARKLTEANLQICERNNWSWDVSRGHRILGDLCANAELRDDAVGHYSQALNIVRSLSHKVLLIETLLARGRWTARQLHDSPAAFGDLKEALGYAKAGSYRLYEADIRNGLAWAHLVAGNRDAARDEARFARHMSQERGYHWGIVDAEEVLDKIG